MSTVDVKVAPRGHEGNQLIEACGPILDPHEMAQRLLFLPSQPSNVGNIPPYIRPYEIVDLRNLHVPSPETIRVARAIDVLVRSGYVQRDPRERATWQRIYSRSEVPGKPKQSPLVCTVEGVPGVGKTAAVEQALSLSPQIVVHEQFPGLIGQVRQVVWLKVEIPSSGRAVDFVEALMRATDDALGAEYFLRHYHSGRRSAVSMLNDWLNKTACHFIGILVLDEINNLFKIETLAEQRRKVGKKGTPAVRVADDEALKLILYLINSAPMPIAISGTPDCLPILATRCSTAQRLVSGGFHKLTHFEAPSTKQFAECLLPTLLRYQWFEQKLPMSNELAQLVHQLSGGISRICNALWRHAHLAAFERGAMRLELDDFRHAAGGPLAFVAPSVAALLSDDPAKLNRYVDLARASESEWRSL